jgi:uncharacterized protein YfaT (DUF1175 family)
VAKELLSREAEARVGLIEDVMLALDQIAAHVQPSRGGDVAWLLRIADDQACQQPQAEWVITVWLAGGLDLRASAADALGVEKRHCIRWLKLK